MVNQQLEQLKTDVMSWNRWQEKESTRDAVFGTIKDFLYADTTGLPQRYTEEEVQSRTTAVYAHLLQTYPTVPSPYYASAAG
jgi:type I restriction enzyme, R subunit